MRAIWRGLKRLLIGFCWGYLILVVAGFVLSMELPNVTDLPLRHVTGDRAQSCYWAHEPVIKDPVLMVDCGEDVTGRLLRLIVYNYWLLLVYTPVAAFGLYLYAAGEVVLVAMALFVVTGLVYTPLIVLARRLMRRRLRRSP